MGGGTRTTVIIIPHSAFWNFFEIFGDFPKYLLFSLWRWYLNTENVSEAGPRLDLVGSWGPSLRLDAYSQGTECGVWSPRHGVCGTHYPASALDSLSLHPSVILCGTLLRDVAELMGRLCPQGTSLQQSFVVFLLPCCVGCHSRYSHPGTFLRTRATV